MDLIYCALLRLAALQDALVHCRTDVGPGTFYMHLLLIMYHEVVSDNFEVSRERKREHPALLVPRVIELRIC